jgi:hypothetical protein
MAQSFGIDLSAFGDSKISIEDLMPLLEQDIQFDPATPDEAEEAIKAIENRLDERARMYGNTPAIQALIAAVKLQTRGHILSLVSRRYDGLAGHSEK